MKSYTLGNWDGKHTGLPWEQQPQNPRTSPSNIPHLLESMGRISLSDTSPGNKDLSYNASIVDDTCRQDELGFLGRRLEGQYVTAASNTNASSSKKDTQHDPNIRTTVTTPSIAMALYPIQANMSQSSSTNPSRMFRSGQLTIIGMQDSRSIRANTVDQADVHPNTEMSPSKRVAATDTPQFSLFSPPDSPLTVSDHESLMNSPEKLAEVEGVDLITFPNANGKDDNIAKTPNAYVSLLDTNHYEIIESSEYVSTTNSRRQSPNRFESPLFTPSSDVPSVHGLFTPPPSSDAKSGNALFSLPFCYDSTTFSDSRKMSTVSKPTSHRGVLSHVSIPPLPSGHEKSDYRRIESPIKAQKQTPIVIDLTKDDSSEYSEPTKAIPEKKESKPSDPAAGLLPLILSLPGKKRLRPDFDDEDYAQKGREKRRDLQHKWKDPELANPLHEKGRGTTTYSYDADNDFTRIYFDSIPPITLQALLWNTRFIRAAFSGKEKQDMGLKDGITENRTTLTYMEHKPCLVWPCMDSLPSDATASEFTVGNTVTLEWCADLEERLGTEASVMHNAGERIEAEVKKPRAPTLDLAKIMLDKKKRRKRFKAASITATKMIQYPIQTTPSKIRSEGYEEFVSDHRRPSLKALGKRKATNTVADIPFPAIGDHAAWDRTLHSGPNRGNNDVDPLISVAFNRYGSISTSGRRNDFLNAHTATHSLGFNFDDYVGSASSANDPYTVDTSGEFGPTNDTSLTEDITPFSAPVIPHSFAEEIATDPWAFQHQSLTPTNDLQTIDPTLLGGSDYMFSSVTKPAGGSHSSLHLSQQLQPKPSSMTPQLPELSLSPLSSISSGTKSIDAVSPSSADKSLSPQLIQRKLPSRTRKRPSGYDDMVNVALLELSSDSSGKSREVSPNFKPNHVSVQPKASIVVKVLKAKVGRPSAAAKLQATSVSRPEGRYCHQCRRKAFEGNMICSSCSKAYCFRCITVRYPDITPDGTQTDFVCPFCMNTCSCDVCCRKRGEEFVSLRPKTKQFTAPILRSGRGTSAATQVTTPTPTPTPTSFPQTISGPMSYWGAVYDMKGNKIATAFVGADGKEDLVTTQPIAEAPTNTTSIAPTKVQPVKGNKIVTTYVEADGIESLVTTQPVAEAPANPTSTVPTKVLPTKDNKIATAFMEAGGKDLVTTQPIAEAPANPTFIVPTKVRPITPSPIKKKPRKRIFVGAIQTSWRLGSRPKVKLLRADLHKRKVNSKQRSKRLYIGDFYPLSLPFVPSEFNEYSDEWDVFGMSPLSSLQDLEEEHPKIFSIDSLDESDVALAIKLSLAACGIAFTE